MLLGRFKINGRTIQVDFSRTESLAIPLDPHGRQPSFFASQPAAAEPLRNGTYVGSVNAGGSCNAEIIRHAPHCHGTHTEGIGHLLPAADPVQNTIDNRPGLCRIISVHGTASADCDEQYSINLPGEQRLISYTEIRELLEPRNPDDYQALIIRSLPNSKNKQYRNYSEQPAYPILSTQALKWLASSKLVHLLVDMPSLDATDDHGRLANHRTWWGIGDNISIDPIFAATRSVTEMIFVSDHVEDGEYWLQLQLSAIVSDACSSRPMIYHLVATNENN